MHDFKQVTLTQKDYKMLEKYTGNKEYKKILDFFNKHYHDFFATIPITNCTYNGNLLSYIECIELYTLQLQARKYHNNITNKKLHKKRIKEKIIDNINDAWCYINSYKNLI